MVVTKTFQHTYEHSDTLLRIAYGGGHPKERVTMSEQNGSFKTEFYKRSKQPGQN
jgi:hypothetical protein